MIKLRATASGRCMICGRVYLKGDWIVRLSVTHFKHLFCPSLPK